MLIRFFLLSFPLVLAITACAADLPFKVHPVAAFDEPWAIAFLPDGRMLITEKKGRLFIVQQNGKKSKPIVGVPLVDYGGQGGLGDVALHPDFANNQQIYISYAESGEDGTRGAAVARAQLVEDVGGPALKQLEVIWRQYPKVSGHGHYGHRLLFDSDSYLWISSGERQKFESAQDLQSNLGKVVRLHADGSVPKDNPFVDYRHNAAAGEVAVHRQIWSLGHRNPLGMAFDARERLWVIEMGPAGGDELNLVERGQNYGYPLVSNGDHYDGRKIPDHNTRPEFVAPITWWTPVISPADMIVYGGNLFPQWQGSALVAGLSAQGIVRIALGAEEAEEVARYPMGARIRSITEAPGGALWVLEDERGDSKGRLLKLTPAP